MSTALSLATLSETEFELIKTKLTDLPKEPLDRILAIAQIIIDCGVEEERLTDVFREVCNRLQRSNTQQTTNYYLGRYQEFCSSNEVHLKDLDIGTIFGGEKDKKIRIYRPYMASRG